MQQWKIFWPQKDDGVQNNHDYSHRNMLQLKQRRQSNKHKCKTNMVSFLPCLNITANLPLSFLKSRASCLSVTISRKFTMFGCCNWRRIFISRTAVMGNPSFSFSRRTFFRATNMPAETKNWWEKTWTTCLYLGVNNQTCPRNYLPQNQFTRSLYCEYSQVMCNEWKRAVHVFEKTW